MDWFAENFYEGDRPAASVQQEVEDWLHAARTDPATARQIFGIFTYRVRTGKSYDERRDFMICEGIPASFLPDPEPGRFTPARDVR
ncbi:hypothetical protein ABZ914_19865 [Spirillospora sp. NPDC046719]